MTDTIKAKDVKHNAFTENLKTDYVAVDAAGNPVARAADKESAERAAPGHSGLFTGKDFSKADTAPRETPEPATPTTDNVDPTAVATARPAEPEPATDGLPNLGGEPDDKTLPDLSKDEDKDDGKKSSRQRKPSGE